MKLKIFISTFALPLLWLANFIVKENYQGYFFNQYVALGLFLGSLLKLVISKRFLIDVIVNDNSLRFEYYNQFMTRKTLTLSTLDISNVKYVDKNWLLDEFDKLEFKIPKETLEFYLTTKIIKEKIRAEPFIKRNEKVKV